MSQYTFVGVCVQRSYDGLYIKVIILPHSIVVGRSFKEYRYVHVRRPCRSPERICRNDNEGYRREMALRCKFTLRMQQPTYGGTKVIVSATTVVLGRRTRFLLDTASKPRLWQRRFYVGAGGYSPPTVSLTAWS